MTASTTQPKQPEPTPSIAEQDAAAPVNWSTKTSLVVAGCVVVLTMVVLLIPWWQLQVAITLGALAYVLLVKANPLRRFFFAGMSCFGVAAAPMVLPSLAAKLHIDTAVVFEFVSESSGLGQGLFALIGFGCIVLDYFYTHPRRSAESSNQPTDHPGQAPPNLVGGGNSQNQTVNVTINSPTPPSPTVQPKTIDPPDSANAAEPPFNVPNLPQHYVAREAKLAELHDALSSEKEPGVALWAAAAGHGGQGKSILAIGYGHRYRDEYPGGCFWLPCENARPISAMAKLEEEMGLERSVNEQASADVVKRALESAPLSLLILDNIVGREQWKQWNDDGLVPSASCHVIVTSRQRGLPKLEEIKVARLTAGEARKLLKKFKTFKSGSDDAAAADKIAEHVGYLAVAVAAIGVKVKRTPGATYPGYWEDLKTRPQLAIPEADDVDKDHLEYENALSDIIDEAFDALDAVQQRMIQYAALLPEDMIPKNWLRWLIEHDEELTLPDVAGVTGGAAAGALAALMEDDVLRPADEDGNLVSFHRLWAHHVAEQLDIGGKSKTRLIDRIANCAQSRHDDIVGKSLDAPAILTDPTYRWELTPLAAVCRSLWENDVIVAAARLGRWLASAMRHMGRFSASEGCLSQVIRRAEDVDDILGDDELASCLNELGQTLHGLGKLSDGRLCMERAIEIVEKAYPSAQQSLSACYSNLALILQDLGDLSGARAQMERAIEINEKVLHDDHPCRARDYSNLAIILQNLGDLSGARALMERAIEINEKDYDANHPMLAIRYANLAIILKDLGDLLGARSLMERAININERVLDKNHPTLAINYANFAMILKDLDDLSGARSLMARAFAIGEKAYDADHPALAIRYHNMAGIEAAEHDFAAALEWETQANRILHQHFNDEHPHVQSSGRALASYKAKFAAPYGDAPPPTGDK